MAKLSIGLAAIILGVLCLTSQAFTSSYTPTSDPEEYRVYSTIIDMVHLSRETSLVVIESQTLEASFSIDNKLLHFKDKLSPLAQDTMEDFDQRNRQSESLRRLFKIGSKYFVITKAAQNKYFEEGGGHWEAFYKSYPNSLGLIAFSRVGFNKSKDQALVYVSQSCGRRCGTGIYYLLSKEGNRWSIGSEYLIFQS